MCEVISSRECNFFLISGVQYLHYITVIVTDAVDLIKYSIVSSNIDCAETLLHLYDYYYSFRDTDTLLSSD